MTSGEGEVSVDVNDSDTCVGVLVAVSVDVFVRVRGGVADSDPERVFVAVCVPDHDPLSVCVDVSDAVGVGEQSGANGLFAANAGAPAAATSTTPEGELSTRNSASLVAERRSTVCPGATPAMLPPELVCDSVSGAAGGVKGAVYTATPATTRMFVTKPEKFASVRISAVTRVADCVAVDDAVTVASAVGASVCVRVCVDVLVTDCDADPVDIAESLAVADDDGESPYVSDAVGEPVRVVPNDGE